MVHKQREPGLGSEDRRADLPGTYARAQRVLTIGWGDLLLTQTRFVTVAQQWVVIVLQLVNRVQHHRGLETILDLSLWGFSVRRGVVFPALLSMILLGSAGCSTMPVS